MNHPWPGNVRELQHSMEKAIILSDQALIGAELFSFRAGNQQEIPSLIGSLQEMEQVMIQKAMERNHGNVSAAAAQLGVSRQTLYNKLKSLKDQDY
jgi:transcriptional regulator with PAS, ATPase and Fis domain